MVLRMEWPQDLDPSKIENFESEARNRRYRLLGTACRQQDVNSLLIAHHADDQAETVLIRLATGHRAIGLQGIQARADIPECWGIHGLCRSGGYGQENSRDLYRSTGQRTDDNTVPKTALLPFEYGGIRIYRPFLPFTKDRLIATCASKGVNWVEDKTNEDPTLTARNTARKLLDSGRLPDALQKPSMIALAKSTRLRVMALENSVERLLQDCDILSFDNRVGSLAVYIPKEVTQFQFLGRHPKDEVKRLEINHVFKVSILLRRLIEIVSPVETVQLRSLQAAAQTICASNDTVPGFTAGSVKFQRSEISTSDFDAPLKHRKPTTPYKDSRFYSQRGRSNKKLIWILSRQPYRSDKPAPTIVISNCKAAKNFALWDGRFWIQVQNNTPHDICVRPLRKSDSIIPTPPGSTTTSRSLGLTLNEAAPGDIRWTLPVIAFTDDVVLPHGEQRVVALPSLGITCGNWGSLIKWTIRYKKIDMPVTHMDAGALETAGSDYMVRGDAPGCVSARNTTE